MILPVRLFFLSFLVITGALAREPLPVERPDPPSATEASEQEAGPPSSEAPHDDVAETPFDEAVTVDEAEPDDGLDMPVETLDLPPDITVQERVQLSEDFLRLGETDQALSVWEDVQGEVPSKLALYDKVLAEYRKQGQHWKVFQILQRKLLALAEAPTLVGPLVNPADAVNDEITTLIQTDMKEDELRRVVKTSGVAFPADVAMIRLIALYEAQGDAYLTAQEIAHFTEVFPRHPALSQVKSVAERMRQKTQSSRYRIGALFRTTGDSAVFSDSALKGVYLALRQAPAIEGGVGLVVEAFPDQAATPEALRKWLEENRLIALVGPLLSKDVNRVAPITETLGLPLVTPGATAASLASLGKSVIRNASTGRAQCHVIAQYAVSEMRQVRFAVLFPKTDRGETWAKCFSEQVKKRGGEVILMASYQAGETDFAEPILRVKNAAVKPDAIFLPGDARTVGLLLPQMTFHGVRGFPLLGTAEWRHPSFLRLAGHHAEGAVFADGFFPESPDPAIRQFVEQYEREYHQTPDILAAQAYDATRLILDAIANGAVTSKAVTAALLSTTQFQGASGLILEVQNGETVKQPLLVGVRQGRFVQIQP